MSLGVSAMIDERPLRAVPWLSVLLLVGAFALQIASGLTREGPAVEREALPAAWSLSSLRVAALGAPEAAARILMLWLQAFDYQPGVSIAFMELDYDRVSMWLERILALDPSFSYPMLAASRLYGEVPDPVRQRMMLDFVARHFDADPARHWQWMAHAVYLAKHRLKDLDLALGYARRLAAVDASLAVPGWARQMQIFVLEDMGELESARVLLGGLLDSGEITDPHEQWFLSQRLHELEQQIASGGENDQSM